MTSEFKTAVLKTWAGAPENFEEAMLRFLTKDCPFEDVIDCIEILGILRREKNENVNTHHPQIHQAK